MATSLGIEPILNSSGQPTSGTSAQDIRDGLVNGLFADDGVIYGAKVTPVTGTMNYKIAKGSCVFSTSNGRVIGPIHATTITVPNKPNIWKTHRIIAKQNNSSSNNSITYHVIGRAAVPADGEVVLETFTVPVGDSNLNKAKRAATGVNDVNWRNTAGQLLGKDTLSFSGYMKKNTSKLALKRTITGKAMDRWVRIDIGYSVDLQTRNAKGQVNEACFIWVKDGTKTIRTFTTGLLDNTWTRAGMFSTWVLVPANTKKTYTVRFGTSISGNKTAKSFIYMRNGTAVYTDAGPADQ